MPAYKPLADRFWAKVRKSEDIDGCWGWSAATSRDGYPWIRISQEDGMAHAHRLSWELHFGPIPDDLYVLHSCDRPVCTNPKHLFLGTQQDNMNDMQRKGRRGERGGARGEASGSAKLTESQVLEIRRLYAMGNTSQAKLAKQFSMSVTPISLIVRRATWKHI